MKSKKKIKEIDEDMSMTFISDVGQKSAIADDTLSDISGVYDIKKDTSNEEKVIEDNKYDDFNMMNYNNFNKKGVIITIILMIICLIVGSTSTYFIVNKSKKETIKTDNKEIKEKGKEEKSEEISPDSIYVRELISNYDNDSISYPYYKYLYSSNKIIIKELDEDFLKILAAKKANNNLVQANFSGDRFQESVKQLYGDQVKFENADISFDKGCIKLIYDEDDDIYRSKIGECASTTNVFLNRKITKAVKKDNKIEVNIAISYTVDKDIYRDYDFNEKEGIEKLEDTNIDTFDIDKNYTGLNQFKYTFVYDKENLNYYLTTVEKIK